MTLYNLCFTACREDQYRCNDGKCVSSSLVCNGNDDCADGSDEVDHTCSK